jgi:hypothetical protein
MIARAGGSAALTLTVLVGLLSAPLAPATAAEPDDLTGAVEAATVEETPAPSEADAARGGPADAPVATEPVEDEPAPDEGGRDRAGRAVPPSASEDGEGQGAAADPGTDAEEPVRAEPEAAPSSERGTGADAVLAELDQGPPELQLTVHKRNDADGDGTFSDVEEVKGSSAAVRFRVGIRNPSEVPLTIESAVDEIGTTTLDLLDADRCPQLATTLEPDGHVACTFTLATYLRTYDVPPYDELSNTVRVVAVSGDRQVEAADSSTVINPNAGRISAEVTKTNDADGDGVFTDAEQAAAPGQTVTFQVVVSNTSPGTAMITSLTDSWEGLEEPLDLLELCPSLRGVRLRGIGGGHDDDGHDDGGCGGGDDHDDGGCGGHDDGATDGFTALEGGEGDDHGDGGCGGGDDHGDGGDDHGGSGGGCGGRDRPSTITCTFTLEGYAPPSSGSVTNTVTVTLVKPHDRETIATASDTSTVSTAAPPVGEAAISLEHRVGLAGGPFGDHDEAPGLLVTIPAGGIDVGYELEVANHGEVPLAGIELAAGDLDLSGCTIPELLLPEAAFTCRSAPVAAALGDHVSEGTVRATGADRLVSATDLAHYRGVAATIPDGPAPPNGPDTPPTPDSEVLADTIVRPAAAATPARPTTGTSSLPATGAGLLIVVLMALASLGIGTALLRGRT